MRPQHSAGEQEPRAHRHVLAFGGANIASIMAFDSGSVFVSSQISVSPQHSTVPSKRSAQEWRSPALI